MSRSNVWQEVDRYFMQQAYEQACAAEEQAEVPVGAVAVIPKNEKARQALQFERDNLKRTGQIKNTDPLPLSPADFTLVGQGSNQVIQQQDPSAHAEMLALQRAAKTLGNYRLGEVILYVTLEPCAMCAGLLIHSRVARLVYGASDPKTGAAGGVFNLLQHPKLNHQVSLESGVLGELCSQQLKKFFKSRR